MSERTDNEKKLKEAADNIEKLVVAANELNARLAKLENADQPEKPEVIRDRLDRQRQLREGDLETRRYLKNPGTRSQAVPVNAKRYEDIKARYTSIDAHKVQHKQHIPGKRVQDEVQFYCWKENKICLVTLAAVSPPTEVKNA